LFIKQSNTSSSILLNANNFLKYVQLLLKKNWYSA